MGKTIPRPFPAPLFVWDQTCMHNQELTPFPPLSFLSIVEVFCGTEELLLHSKILGKYWEKITTSEQVTSAMMYLQRDISDLLTQLRISFQAWQSITQNMRQNKLTSSLSVQADFTKICVWET